MKTRNVKGFVIVFHVVFLGVLGLGMARAQESDSAWTQPFRLSTGEGKANDASLVADQFGYAHIFWPEELPDFRTTVQYARFDGNTWSTPIDILITEPFRTIGSVSAVADSQGIIHLIWTDEQQDQVFYLSAPAYNALSARDWSLPTLIDIPAKNATLKVDSKGVLHILYTKLQEPAGVYYTRSEDQGFSWSNPTWLDPDIPAGSIPAAFQFVLDDSDGLHAAWSYQALSGTGVDLDTLRASSDESWIRYTHSLDGGSTWSTLYTIDRGLSGPGGISAMVAHGQSIHVIWSAGELFYRHHRFSTDAGRSWSSPARILGDLNGAAGDGIVVDGDGRVHYFAQIRFPQGIYHTYWDGDRWSTPYLVYLIRYDPFDSIGDRIHAHATKPVVRVGNQLVLTFMDPPPHPNRRLFVMYRNLEDLSQLTPFPTPTLTAVPEVTPTSAIAIPSSTPNQLSVNPEVSPTPAGIPNPGTTIWFGILPVLILIGLTMVLRLRGINRH